MQPSYGRSSSVRELLKSGSRKFSRSTPGSGISRLCLGRLTREKLTNWATLTLYYLLIIAKVSKTKLTKQYVVIDYVYVIINHRRLTSNLFIKKYKYYIHTIMEEFYY